MESVTDQFSASNLRVSDLLFHGRPAFYWRFWVAQKMVLNFLHCRTGGDNEKILNQQLTDDVLDRSFRGNASRACAKKGMELPPDFGWEFQRDELQQSQRDGRQHDKAFITRPAVFNLLHAFFSRRLQRLIVLRLSRVSRELLSPPE